MLIIEPLDKTTHQREKFDCGNDKLNYYLKRTARQHAERDVSKTYVLVDSENRQEIIGYYTLTICAIVLTEMPEGFADDFSSETPVHGGKLGRIAVAKKHQRCGYSIKMMADAMRKTVEVANTHGLAAFFVDAKDEGLATYYAGTFDFHACIPSDPLRLFIAVDTLRAAIRAAGKRTPSATVIKIPGSAN